MKDLAEHLLALSLGIVVLVAAVRWAWTVLSPLTPFMLVGLCVVVVVPALVRRYRGW